MIRSDLRYHSDAFIVVQVTIDLLVAARNENDKAQKKMHLKIMLNLDHAFQKLTVH